VPGLFSTALFAAPVMPLQTWFDRRGWLAHR